MVKDVRIQNCIDNYDKYVEILATFPDKELSIKLELVYLQSEIAYKTKNEASIELLEIWHRQIIEARIYKAENNIPDRRNEIKEAIVDIETVIVKTEERQEILKKIDNSVEQPIDDVQPDEDKNHGSQLSIF